MESGGSGLGDIEGKTLHFGFLVSLSLKQAS
jgi:hypothetical protein